MILHGHFENGVVVLDAGTPPHDGTRVTLSVVEPSKPVDNIGFLPIPFPLIRKGQPQSVDLTNAMIAELLDEEDALARH